MPELSREPETVSSPEPVEQQSSLVPHRSSNIAQEGRLKQMGVRPYASLLNIDDLDDCDWLEHAAFDPVEAASREKVRMVTFHPYVLPNFMVHICNFAHYHHWAPLGPDPCALRHRRVTQTLSLHTFVCLIPIDSCTTHESMSYVSHWEQSSLSCASWSLFPFRWLMSRLPRTQQTLNLQAQLWRKISQNPR